MPDIYISRKGIHMEQADKKFEQTELSELKSKLSKQEYEYKLIQEGNNKEMEELKKEMGFLKGVQYGRVLAEEIKRHQKNPNEIPENWKRYAKELGEILTQIK